jgi:DNA-binding response OmpR family regulator
MSNHETILIVDDTPTNLAVLFGYLEDANFNVFVNTSGEFALKTINRIEPDIILLDIMMSGSDGFEVCRQLKANEETRDIPVMFMTALTDMADEIKGLKLGAVDYITKPIKAEVLLARIRTHLTTCDLQKKLKKQNAELEAFSQIMAHDIKNQLGAINGYTKRLETIVTETDHKELMKLSHNLQLSSYKAMNIVDSLLLLTGIHKEAVSMVPIAMDKIIEQVWDRLTIIKEKYQGELILPDSWPDAMGYAPWVEEIWVNYLSNGLKYGGRPPHLKLGATVQNDGMIRFWVQDNGPGIALEAQEALFTKFTHRHDNIQNEGYGLSIVRRIMEKIGGQAGVESRIGHGSLFYFTLPAPE